MATTTTTKVINTNRSELSRRFTLSGLQVRSNALTLLEAELKHGLPPYECVDQFISQLNEVLLTKMSPDAMIIDGDLAEKAIEILREERRLNSTTSQLETASEWIVIKNVAERVDDSTVVTTATTSKGAGQFSQQYSQLITGLKKLPVFTSGEFRLTSIDELNVYDSTLPLKCILFALVRKDPSRIMEYLLEDPTGKVPVTFAKDYTTYREWATFENGIYLIEGDYDARRDVVLVKSIGLPPPNVAMLPGGGPEAALTTAKKDSMVIVLADIHLDQPKTLEALKFLFTGYSQVDVVPEVFVLMGDFTEKRVDHFDLKDHLKALVKLIGTFRRLANQSRFVFVPGPNDFRSEESHQSASSQVESSHEAIVIHPFTSDHFPTTTTKLAHYYLASNPFHLQLGGRNLTLYSAPLLTAASRHVLPSSVETSRSSLLSPRNIDSFLASLSRLMVSSAHLQAGISRSYASALSLFPRIADTILLADVAAGTDFQQVSIYDEAVSFTTMGSFSRGDGQFVCYYTDTNTVEESQVST